MGFLIFMPLRSGFAQDLLETYQLAVLNDPDYKSAVFNQQAISEIKSQSIAQMLPNLSTTAGTSYNRLDNKKASFQGLGVQDYWDHTFGINLKQPVFNWGHWIQLDQADNKIAQADAQRQAKFQSLITRTVTAYFNVLAAHDVLEYTIAEKKAIERQLEQAKQRYEVGRFAITDVYEAQADFDRTVASEIEAINLRDNAKEALREIIGENNVELNPLRESIAFNPPNPEDISAWSSNAESSNFSIVAQFNQAELTRKTVDLQQSKHLPTLDIIAQYRLEDSNSSFGLRGDTESVGLQLNVPLFEGGATLSRTRQAEYEYEAAKEELIKVKRSVNRNVKDAYRGVLTSISKVKALHAATQSAASAVEAAEAGFEVGIRTMVDVLTEQRNLFKAKSDYAKSRYDYLVNGVKLKEAAGSLSEEDLQLINQYLSAKP